VPNLVSSDYQHEDNSATTLTTATITPDPGDVLVALLATWDKTIPMQTPVDSASALTFAQLKIAAPGTGFFGWAGAYGVKIGASSPGPITISSTPAGTCRHAMVLARLSAADLAATPNVNATISGSGAPSSAITTSAANSMVLAVLVDEASQDPATPAYLGGGTELVLYDGHVGSNSVMYFWRTSFAGAGSQTVGLSAPSGMSWVMSAVEILDAATPLTLADPSVGAVRAVAGGTETPSIGLTLADPAAGGVRAVSGGVETPAIGIVLADPTAGVVRAVSGGQETASIGLTLSDPSGGAARAAGVAGEQPVFGLTLTDALAGVIRAVGATEVISGAQNAPTNRGSMRYAHRSAPTMRGI
jgi:hypothetical protein